MNIRNKQKGGYKKMILNINNIQRELLLNLLKESQQQNFSDDIQIIISRLEQLK
jgi:hypothetical protein